MLRNIKHNEKQRDEYHEFDKQRDEKTKKILETMGEEEKLKKDHNESDTESDNDDDSEEYDQRKSDDHSDSDVDDDSDSDDDSEDDA